MSFSDMKIIMPVFKLPWYKRLYYWLFRIKYQPFKEINAKEFVSTQPMTDNRFDDKFYFTDYKKR